MNLLIAEKNNGVFQKIGVMNGNDFSGGLLAYGLACNAKSFLDGDSAAISIDYLLEGIEYRVSKF
jgi:hypothetical protein